MMKPNPYSQSERGTVIYIGETEPLSIQEERTVTYTGGRGTVIYTGETEPLPIQRRRSVI